MDERSQQAQDSLPKLVMVGLACLKVGNHLVLSVIHQLNQVNFVSG